MSNRDLPEGKEWSSRKFDNFTAICEPIAYDSQAYGPRCPLTGIDLPFLLVNIDGVTKRKEKLGYRTPL
jgi:hypothetical protein